jgi:hypothetical protein
MLRDPISLASLRSCLIVKVHVRTRIVYHSHTAFFSAFLFLVEPPQVGMRKQATPQRHTMGKEPPQKSSLHRTNIAQNMPL